MLALKQKLVVKILWFLLRNPQSLGAAMRLLLLLLACLLGCNHSEDPGEWRATGDSGRTIFHSKTGEVRPVRDADGRVITYPRDKK